MKLYPFHFFFFQIIKGCSKVYVQATAMFEIISIGMFQKEAIVLLLLEYVI